MKNACVRDLILGPISRAERLSYVPASQGTPRANCPRRGTSRRAARSAANPGQTAPKRIAGMRRLAEPLPFRWRATPVLPDEEDAPFASRGSAVNRLAGRYSLGHRREGTVAPNVRAYRFDGADWGRLGWPCSGSSTLGRVRAWNAFGAGPDAPPSLSHRQMALSPWATSAASCFVLSIQYS